MQKKQLINVFIGVLGILALMALLIMPAEPSDNHIGTTEVHRQITEQEVADFNSYVDEQAWNEAAWIHTTNEENFYTELERIETERAAEAARQAAVATVSTTSPVGVTSSGLPCGGTLPPCYVMERESGGNISIQNQQGSSACGKWQILDSTWNGYGGYSSACAAPESVQDAKAEELWDGGNGCGHWNAC